MFCLISLMFLSVVKLSGFVLFYLAIRWIFFLKSKSSRSAGAWSPSMWPNVLLSWMYGTKLYDFLALRTGLWSPRFFCSGLTKKFNFSLCDLLSLSSSE